MSEDSTPHSGRDDGSTHWADCYRAHHDCAIARVERLQEQLETLHAAAHEVYRIATSKGMLFATDPDTRSDALAGFYVAPHPMNQLGKALLAARDASSPATTAFQWLIERGQPEGLANAEWLEHSAEHPARDRQWTRDAWAAAMFPDRETAERFIADQSLEARAVEHGFASDPASGSDA